ncbi:hypothetical protein F2Q68_00030788 [Brassica cretica]|uniref:Uncharacterized protein n=1 Tax=Brassica cretica TaxID=69181 RepID=A0A8S9G755_BRACR|nr:hypothetical protein F2Q68_00030788 [Brassica cretica]
MYLLGCSNCTPDKTLRWKSHSYCLSDEPLQYQDVKAMNPDAKILQIQREISLNLPKMQRHSFDLPNDPNYKMISHSASFKEPTCASSAYVLINATNSCAYLRLSGTRLLLCNGRLRAPLFRIFRLSVWHRPIWRGAILAPLSSLTVWFTGLSALLELPPSWHSSRFQAAVAAVDSQKQASHYIRRDQGN